MNERQMVFVSLALALLGIALLFFLAETMKPKKQRFKAMQTVK